MENAKDKKPLKNDRVWIELDVPRNEQHAKEICTKANNMLTRLGTTSGRQFFWMEGQYCFGGDMGYVDLPDRGTWFNLDYVGREGE